MKKLIQFSFLLLLMPLLAPTCRSEEFQPSKGILFQLNVQAEIVNANATKASDPEYNKTYTVNLGEEFKNRYNVDPSRLNSLRVDTLIVFFSQDRCKQLAYYEVVVTLPSGKTYTAKDKCDNLPQYQKVGALIFIVPSNTATDAQSILNTDYASDIKSGKSLSISFKMKAASDFGAGFGATAYLATYAFYNP